MMGYRMMGTWSDHKLMARNAQVALALAGRVVHVAAEEHSAVHRACPKLF